MAKSENRVNFTATALKMVRCEPSGKPDKSGRVYLYDAKVPGLAFCVTETGSRSFYFCRNVNGKSQRIKLGAESELTVDKARTKAGGMALEIAAGKDPLAEKRERAIAAARTVATLGALWEAYRSEHLANKKAATLEEFTRLYDAHLAMWKDTPLQEITKDECRAIHKKVGTKSKYTANRVLAILSAMFRDKGGEFGLPEDWTPTAKIKRFPETARDRVLSPEELAALLDAIDADENDVARDYFRMMLYTGSRKAKLAEMAWQQISMQRKTWTVPGVAMKNHTALVVNLVDEAVAILKRRAENNPTASPFVFPARALMASQVEQVRTCRKAGKSTRQIAGELGISQSSVMRACDPAFTIEPPRPFNGVGVAWVRIKTRAGITTRTTPHDLRRTYVTNLLESGAALMHVASAVGHRSMETTQKHYSVARQDKVADAVRHGVAAMLHEAQAAKATADAAKKMAA